MGRVWDIFVFPLTRESRPPRLQPSRSEAFGDFGWWGPLKSGAGRGDRSSPSHNQRLCVGHKTQTLHGTAIYNNIYIYGLATLTPLAPPQCRYTWNVWVHASNQRVFLRSEAAHQPSLPRCFSSIAVELAPGWMGELRQPQEGAQKSEMKTKQIHTWTFFRGVLFGGQWWAGAKPARAPLVGRSWHTRPWARDRTWTSTENALGVTPSTPSTCTEGFQSLDGKGESQSQPRRDPGPEFSGGVGPESSRGIRGRRSNPGFEGPVECPSLSDWEESIHSRIRDTSTEGPGVNPRSYATIRVGVPLSHPLT